uniref:Sphingomyelinase n=1 Tax=Rhipicephalus zambeziensis TaxID=60191 RepID=A0A224YEW6_9ACAR
MQRTFSPILQVREVMKFRSLFTASILFTSLLGAASKIRPRQRPFFVIGHMANTIPEVDQFLGEGANSVEVDIEFAKNGTVLGTHHELFPCECFRVCGKRTNIKKFLTHIHDITAHPSSRYAGKMVLLFLDLKTSKVPAEYKLTAGRTLAESLVKYLWNGVPEHRTMNVLLSIGYTNDQNVLKGAIKYLSQEKYAHLQRRIGFDVGMNAPLHDIRRMYEKMGITHHRWQGDGLMNCFRLLIPHNRLKKAIKERDRPGGYINKVYYWTVDLPESIAEAVRLGIDGIITNRPQNAFDVVTREFSGELKIATVNDNPWEKFQRPQNAKGADYYPNKRGDESRKSN